MQIAQIYYKQTGSGFSDLPLKVNNVGYYKNIGSFYPISDEFYDDYLLIYNFHGEIDIWINYECIPVYGGNIILLPPGFCHKFTYYNRSGAQYFWCHFSGTTACEIADKLIKSHGKIFEIGLYKSISSIFEQIYESMLQSSEDITNGLLYTLLFSVSTLADNDLSTENNVMDVLNSIIFIQNNYNMNITVDDLCNICHTSKYNFMRKFKMVTGTPVHQFLIDYRIMQAKSFLSDTDMNIKEIATQVGFTDNMYFSRVFKKHCGVNPTDYRKKLNEPKTN